MPPPTVVHFHDFQELLALDCTCHPGGHCWPLHAGFPRMRGLLGCVGRITQRRTMTGTTTLHRPRPPKRPLRTPVVGRGLRPCYRPRLTQTDYMPAPSRLSPPPTQGGLRQRADGYFACTHPRGHRPEYGPSLGCYPEPAFFVPIARPPSVHASDT